MAKFADSIGVSQPSVSEWVSGKKRPSPERAIQIEKATNGAIRCEDLRPDIDWSVLRGSGPASPAKDGAA